MFKLKSKINVTLSIRKKIFEFTRIYHSKGKQITDTVECKAIGIRTSPPNHVSPMDVDVNIESEETRIETTIEIEGCDS